MDAKVLIVGAGPAGSWLGFWLGKNDIPAVIIEKENIPRYKACGGILSAKSYDLLAGAVELPPDLIMAKTNSVEFHCGYDRSLYCQTDGKPLKMVMRNELDSFLVEQARKAGTRVVTGKPVERVEIAEDYVRVKAGGEIYRGEYLAAADGARSRVAEQVGAVPEVCRKQRAIALEGEIEYRSNGELGRKIRIDYGVVNGGYSWVLPKGKLLSVGIALMRGGGGNLREHFMAYLKHLDINAQDVGILKGHPIPAGGRNFRRLKHGGHRYLLVGDAAYLADPLIGEGIYQALVSGEIACEAIAESQNHGDYNFAAYDRRLKDRFLEEHAAADLLAEAFYRVPDIFHSLAEKDSTIISTFLKAVQDGGVGYTGLYEKLKGEITGIMRDSIPFIF